MPSYLAPSVQEPRVIEHHDVARLRKKLQTTLGKPGFQEIEVGLAFGVQSNDIIEPESEPHAISLSQLHNRALKADSPFFEGGRIGSG